MELIFIFLLIFVVIWVISAIVNARSLTTAGLIIIVVGLLFNITIAIIVGTILILFDRLDKCDSSRN